MSLIVIVNGIDDDGAPQESRMSDAERVFADQFPTAGVKVFDPFRDQGSGIVSEKYLYDKAKDIIDHLQGFAKDFADDDDDEPKPILFVGHNTGAALIKQILLLASEDRACQWLALNTISLHLIEAPSYRDSSQWEQFFFRLLAADRLPLPNLTALINVLPNALARIETEFSAISNVYNIPLCDESNLVVYSRSEDPWFFQDDGKRLFDEFHQIRASLLKDCAQLSPGYQAFHQALSLPDASINRLSAVNANPESMAWLERHLVYNSWMDDVGSSILNITGLPGSGNTYLSSHILHLLLSKYPDAKAIFLSFSFYRWDTRRNSERSFVASLIRQMLRLRPNFFHRISSVASKLVDLPSISCSQLWDVLRHLLAIPRHSRVFIVLNAVDQCLQPIINNIALLTSTPSVVIPVKVLMTSSHPFEISPDISFRSLPLSESDWGTAIRDIAARRVSHLVSKRPVWKDWENAIVEKLCSGEYSYFYVMLNLDILEHSQTPSTRDALKEQLMRPVPSIERVFFTMVNTAALSGLAKVALNWIFHVARPLTIPELAVALTLGANPSDRWAPTNQTIEDIVETVSWDLMRDLGSQLGLMVKVTNDRILLVHRTFRDYLERNGNLLIPHFHTLITERCLWYLSLCSEHRTKISLEVDKARPQFGVAMAFLDYAGLYWADHYKLEPSPSASLDEDVLQFLDPQDDDHGESQPRRPSAIEFWVQHCNRQSKQECFHNHPLFLAVELGLGEIVKKIIHGRKQKHPKHIEEAIAIAAGSGDSNILKTLLGAASPNVDLIPAIQAAAKHGHVDLLELLMSKMTHGDVEALKSSRDSPLFLAAQNGHTTAVEALLIRGFSLEAMNDQGTAIHLAAQLGDINMLQMINRLRPDEFKLAIEQNGFAFPRDTPLHIACRAGFVEAFDLVLSNTPKDQINRPGLQNWTPAQVAADGGHVAILDKLILFGATIRVGDQFESPLELAARKGHYDAVCRLAEELHQHIADTKDSEAANLEKEEQLTLLNESILSAIGSGHTKVVKYLLQKTERDFENDWRLMKKAVYSGQLDIVKLLVEHHVDVKRQDDKYNNALMDAAIGNNHVHVLRYLVENGLTPQWDEWETSVHFAARCGFKWCLHEVLSVASLEVVRRKDWIARTALESAAYENERETFEMLLAWENENAPPPADSARHSPRALELLISGPSSDVAKKVEFVRFLLEKGWSAKTPKDNQNSAIHAAASNDSGELVQLLIDRGANPNSHGEKDCTPLHIAAASGVEVVAKLLLENGADPNLTNSEGHTPLHEAARGGHSGIVGILLGLEDGSSAESKTADPEKEDQEGRRALHLGASFPDVIRALLKVNPRVDLEAIEPSTGMTTLLLAAEQGADHSVLELLKAGAQPSARDLKGQTPLHLATSCSMARYLMDHGADPDARMDDQSTPLYAALRRKNTEVARYLLEDAKPKANPNIYGGTLHSPLQVAASGGDVSMAALLLDAGADPNAKGGGFESPLHAATWSGSPELVKLLLDHKASPSFCERPFGTPLHVLAAILDNPQLPTRELTTLLCEAGADINAPNHSGQTPLTLAMFSRPDEDLKVLLDMGADPTIVDITQSTGLHYAISTAHSPGLIEELIGAGARPEVTDGCGRDALYIAALVVQEEQQEILTKLLVALPAEKRAAHIAAALPASIKARGQLNYLEFIAGEEKDIDPNVCDRSGWTALDLAECYEKSPEKTALVEMGAIRGPPHEMPTGWSLYDRDGEVSVSEDGLEAFMEGSGNKDTPADVLGTIRANHCIPVDKGIFYFEIEVLECKDTSAITVGLIQESSSLGTLAGSWPDTYGYHSNTGSLLTDDTIVDEGLSYGTGHTVGVSYDRIGKRVWFTLNGQITGKIFESVIGQMYPAVSFQQGLETSRVRVRFPGKDGEQTAFKHEPLDT